MVDILGIETATEACSVALVYGGRTCQEFAIAPRQHARLLLPMVEICLKHFELALSDVDVIAFGAGPGSFMGVRLATAVTQGLAYAQGKPVCGISSLRILAQNAYESSGIEAAMVAWDARMGEIYWGCYQVDEQGIMQVLGEDQLSSPEAMPLHSFTRFTPVGNAWEVYRDSFKQADATWLDQADTSLYPEAKALLSLAACDFSAGKQCSPLEARPNYIRQKVTHA